MNKGKRYQTEVMGGRGEYVKLTRVEDIKLKSWGEGESRLS